MSAIFSVGIALVIALRMGTATPHPYAKSQRASTAPSITETDLAFTPSNVQVPPTADVARKTVPGQTCRELEADKSIDWATKYRRIEERAAKVADNAAKFADNSELFVCDGGILTIQGTSLEVLKERGIPSDPDSGLLAAWYIREELAKSLAVGTITEEQVNRIGPIFDEKGRILAARSLVVSASLKVGYPTMSSATPSLLMKNTAFLMVLHNVRVSLELLSSNNDVIWQGSTTIDHLGPDQQIRQYVGPFLDFIPSSYSFKIDEVEVGSFNM